MFDQLISQAAKEPPYVEIPLTQGFYTIIDREDCKRVSKYKWHTHFSKYHVYARNTDVGRLHRFLVNAPDDLQVDHDDGDTLNNRRSNLVLVTNLENSQKKIKTTYRYRGVYPVRRHHQPYRAWLSNKGNGVHIGYFTTELEAALAYDEVAFKLGKRATRLNFPEMYYPPTH